MSDHLFQDRKYFPQEEDPLPHLTDADDGSDEDEVEMPPPTDGSYVAFRLAPKGTPRLRVIDHQEQTISQPRYNYMEDQLLLGHQWLALIFSHYCLLFHGKHLEQLMPALQDEKVRWLMTFDPAQHYLPADKTAPVILRVHRYTHEQFWAVLAEMAADEAAPPAQASGSPRD